MLLRKFMLGRIADNPKQERDHSSFVKSTNNDRLTIHKGALKLECERTSPIVLPPIKSILVGKILTSFDIYNKLPIF